MNGIDKPILDACCGGKMMYFDKHDPRVLSQDIRKVPRHKIESNGSYFEVSPDVVGDFRKMDFPDNAFSMVIFDPPHLKCGETSFMFYKYGSLGATWENDLRLGFAECFRVLKPNGTLVFKWGQARYIGGACPRSNWTRAALRAHYRQGA